MASLHCSIFLLVHLLILPALSQPPADPLRNFCRRYGHQTAVIDRRLYIDGGWLYANPIPQNPIPTMSTAGTFPFRNLHSNGCVDQGLLYDDLNQSYLGMPKQYANLTKNSSVPDVAGGILWQDEINKVFWLYAGEFSAAPSTFQLWGYDVILNQWNLTSPSLGSTSPVQRVSYGAGVAISESGMGFYYGGYLNNLTNPLWNAPQIATNNLIIYDMDGNTLTNSSGYDNIGRAEGVMVSIPASGAGLLLYFGGVTFPYENDTEVAAPMDTILIYDIGDANWHTQRATGHIPETRRKFCGGATWAKDQSSYNVYIYGGFGFGENATGFDDVYILTMPAFEWIKWYPDHPGPGAPHGLVTCNVIDNSQMIVMGGNFTNTTDCDVPAIQGQHNLNLGQRDSTNEKWHSYLPNLANYFVPTAILQVAGGTPQGGATQKSPANGWDDSRVAVYFGERASFTSRTPTRILPTQTATPRPPPPKPKKKKNIGAIAGGTVCGVVALLLAIGVAWFCLRKRKRNKHNEVASPSTRQYVMGEKHSVVELPPDSTSRVGSPGNNPSHQQPGSIHQSSPYSTPPPMQPEYPYHHPAPGHPPMQYYPHPVQHSQPYYHPAHGPPPVPFYSPPDVNRPEMGRVQSYEMPTVKSPQITEVHQPKPVKPDVAKE